MRYLLGTFIVISAFLSSNSSFAQLAEERTAPFSGVKPSGSNIMLLVDGQWYTAKAINNVSISTIVSYCKKEEKEDWLEYLAEDIVEVMQGLKKPLKTNTTLRLVKDGKTITKTVSVTKEKRRASRDYHYKHYKDQDRSVTRINRDEHSATRKRIGSTPKQVAKSVNISMDKPFLFKSAKVEFNYTGHKLYSGKETLYVDDYGKTVIVITDKPGFMGQKDKKTIIWQDNKTTVIDHVKKTWYTTPIRTKSTEPPVISYSTEKQREQGGYVRKANETVLGKNCQVYEHGQMKVTYWLYKNLDFKMVNYSMGGNAGYTKKPLSIKEGITIPASVLKIPAGYKKQ